MRPVTFDYAAPESVADAVRGLVDGGEDATLIAGGQSLLPVLRLRMADPGVVVDLRKIEGLRSIRDDGDDLVIGAMVTHHEVAHHPLVAEHVDLLAQAARSVGDPQIRYRGTIGGSLAHADPAGDIAPAVLALEATLEISGPDGDRTLPAADFFEDYFTTALTQHEVLTAVRVPKHTGWRMHYEKFSQVAQSWAIVAVAAALLVEDGTVAQARLGMANMGPTPVRAGATERALTGMTLDAEALRRAASSAGEGTSPTSDAGGTPGYRRHLAGALAGRAVVTATSTG